MIDTAKVAGATATDRPFNFVDPWGDHVEIVVYANVQFAMTEVVLRSMGLSLDRIAEPKEELRRKGIAEPGVQG